MKHAIPRKASQFQTLPRVLPRLILTQVISHEIVEQP